MPRALPKFPEPKATVLREGDLGPEKLCKRCLEWWPADPDFFFNHADYAGGLFHICKACYREWQATTRTKSARPRASLLPPPPVALATVPWLGTQSAAAAAP